MFTDGMSRLTVGVCVMVALSLAVFLTVLVLLLADLLCSHLRRRRLRHADMEAPHKRPKLESPPSFTPAADDASVATTATTATTHEAFSSTPPFYYAHGVMSAPACRKDLLLAIPKLEAAANWTWSPPSTGSSYAASHSGGGGFVRISNPVYETPEASPSACGVITEEEEEGGGFSSSPPLSMMRKLPPLGVLACPPPPAFGFVDGRPSSMSAWSGMMAMDANRASSSSSNFTTRFFSS
ncbi:uncharacterized protein LOC104585451 [Brachypodium distachyon]|uniref:Uncharacterized protein n=1 Tax=Brachypodium distachyon TaxID=15368 RepID=A0A0Q3P7J7_BRADI|nr:uncharacterized protein LOC104585451 [Brachypodium distachyon]KQJ84969.1 hypothetical protein BRADI_5g23973v3 [Brachypodium distachyon]|eukprot:XP_010240523.1 uncharacterized protein LOC104585451 [Brachypodium distachyon]